MDKPVYSICICNFNMNNTLKSSLETILLQLNDQFEVVVVDDGSSDGSLNTLLELRNIYSNLRVIPLLRDRRRKLGETRNVSVRAAKGKYLILHIDCDDLWDSFIISFTKIYHELEKRLSREDFFLSGRQIQMGTKKLLLENPYRNIYYGEDRMLWNDLLVLGKLIIIDHQNFRKRIPIKELKRKFFKMIYSQYSFMECAFAYTNNPIQDLSGYLKGILFNMKFPFKRSLLCLILLIPAFLKGLLKFFTHKNIHLFNMKFKYLATINLDELEKQTKDQFGDFPLNSSERDIYFLS